MVNRLLMVGHLVLGSTLVCSCSTATVSKLQRQSEPRAAGGEFNTVRAPRGPDATASAWESLAVASEPVGPTLPEATDDKDPYGSQIRFFKAKARVYFDSGHDEADEVDIFKDGSLTPTLDFVEYLYGFGEDNKTIEKTKGWRWGPTIGLGITAPAADSEDGSVEASGAPIVLVSGGWVFEFPISNALKKDEKILGVEFGYATGFSSDEGVNDTDDGAIYVGMTFDM